MRAEIPDRKGTDSWRTPGWLMAVFRGWFDPCPVGGRNGLDTEWKDPSYVNPPYSDPGPWVDKAVSESRKGKLVVMLLKLDPSTKWHQRLAAAGAHFATFNERLSFVGSSGEGAYFPSVLAILERSAQSELSVTTGLSAPELEEASMECLKAETKRRVLQVLKSHERSVELEVEAGSATGSDLQSVSFLVGYVETIPVCRTKQ